MKMTAVHDLDARPVHLDMKAVICFFFFPLIIFDGVRANDDEAARL